MKNTTKITIILALVIVCWGLVIPSICGFNEIEPKPSSIGVTSTIEDVEILLYTIDNRLKCENYSRIETLFNLTDEELDNLEYQTVTYRQNLQKWALKNSPIIPDRTKYEYIYSDLKDELRLYKMSYALIHDKNGCD